MSPRSSCCTLAAGASAQLLLLALVLFACLALGRLGAASCQEQLNSIVESPAERSIKSVASSGAEQNHNVDPFDYLEKLENLDKYWSEKARPRFGRSEYKQQTRLSPLIQLVRSRPTWARDNAAAPLERDDNPFRAPAYLRFAATNQFD